MERPATSTVGTIIRLALISIVVGIVLSALGITPLNIIDQLRLLFQRLSNLGLGAIESLLSYLMLGAAIVVPVYLVTLLVRRGGDRR
jgi:hypothetical protein